MKHMPRATVWGLVILLSVAVWWIISMMQNQRAPVGVYTPAQIAHQVKHIGTQQVACKSLTVLGDRAKEAMKIDAPINSHIAMAIEVPPDLHTNSVVMLVDRDGKFTASTRREPYPWLGAENRGGLMVGAGRNSKGTTVGRLTAYWYPIRMSNWEIGGSLYADTSMYASAGIDLIRAW